MCSRWPITERLRNRLGDGVLQNVVSLYCAYLVNYAVPLVTIPYLVRILGPASWGLVAMAQGYGNYLNLVVEYGFNLSATREVARYRQSPERVTELMAGVTGARLLLCLGGIALAALLQRAVPALRQDPSVLWAGVAAAVAMGLNPLWYFQGCERMKVVAALEVGAKIAASLGVFVCVHRPEDAWRVLGLQAVASTISTGAGLVMAYREVGLCLPTPATVGAAFQTGWTMFLFRSSAMLYTTGNSFLLGLFAPPEAVGYFAGAEKISKAFMGLLNPFNQAVYPRLSRLVKHSPYDAAKLFRANAAVVGAGGLVLGLAVYAGAPLLVRFLLGPEMMPAVPVLRLLALLPPVIGVNTLLCTQWMVPLGMDGLLNRTILTAGLINICLAVVLAPRYQQMGMACAVTGAELFITLTASFIYFRRRMQNEPSTDLA
jgi:PST family polysaccharide transporter